jgi:large conductance mechanosensitive channel
MRLLQEFREFIVKGNALDLAVAFILGLAFNGVVMSLVNDVIMPPIGVLMGGVDFSDLSVTLQTAKEPGDPLLNGMTAKKKMDPVVLAYGKFINAIIALIIQGFAIFLIVKAINKLRRKPDPAPAVPPAPPADVQLLTEIRDLLKARA